ncbi:hypothetical protein L6Q96_07295 [Candidatus Binatia bacterium]|nr:hypothetical protein [Candidatus Binatia bacterium]
MKQETGPGDPFAALDLVPTLDLAQVKRAYFAALQRHPPHTDPAGFRRVRDAYEALSSPAALARAFANRPMDFEAELHRWDQRFAARIATAVQTQAKIHGRADATRRFVESLSTRTLAQIAAADRA